MIDPDDNGRTMDIFTASADAEWEAIMRDFDDRNTITEDEIIVYGFVKLPKQKDHTQTYTHPIIGGVFVLK